MAKPLKRQIKGGTKFTANSKGMTAEWIVTKRIKTETQNVIYTRVVEGAPQERKYTGQQFGMLLHTGVIKLKKEA